MSAIRRISDKRQLSGIELASYKSLQRMDFTVANSGVGKVHPLSFLSISNKFRVKLPETTSARSQRIIRRTGKSPTFCSGSEEQ